MHAGQVAGVGELPGQADRRVEAEFELVDEAADGARQSCGRHARGTDQHLRSGEGGQGVGVGAGVGVVDADRLQRRARIRMLRQRATSATIARFFRNDSFRVPKW